MIWIYDIKNDDTLDPRELSMVYYTKMDPVTGQWAGGSVSKGAGVASQNQLQGNKFHSTSHALYQMIAGGQPPQDWGEISDQINQISWRNINNGPVIKLSWYVPESGFGVNQKDAFPNAQNNGYFYINIRFLNSISCDVEDSNGGRGFTYILAGDRDDSLGAYYKQDDNGDPYNSHHWQNNDNQMVMSHNSWCKLDTWNTFDRSLTMDYEAMTAAQWAQVVMISVSVGIVAQGCNLDTWEIYWDDLVIAPDNDGDGLADIEEMGTNFGWRWEAESDFTSENIPHGPTWDMFASDGKYYEAQFANADWIEFKKWIPCGRYRLFVTLRSIGLDDSDDYTSTKVMFDKKRLAIIKSKSTDFQRFCVELNFTETGYHTVKLKYHSSLYSGGGGGGVGWDYIEIFDVGSETDIGAQSGFLDHDNDGIDMVEEARFNGIPQTRDVFVEVDWMEGHKPHDDTFSLAIEAYYDLGIILRIELDEKIPKRDEINIAILRVIRVGEDMDEDGQLGIPNEDDDVDNMLDTGYQWWGRHSPVMVDHSAVYHYCVYSKYNTGDYDVVGFARSTPNGNRITGGGAFSVCQQACEDNWLSGWPHYIQHRVEAAAFLHELGHSLSIGDLSAGDEDYCDDDECVMHEINYDNCITLEYCEDHLEQMDLPVINT
jgi:hypothetical protein